MSDKQAFPRPGLLPTEVNHLIQVVAEISAKLFTFTGAEALIERTVRLLQQHTGYDEVILYRCGLSDRDFSAKFMAQPRGGQTVKSYTLEQEISLAHTALRERRLIRIHDLPVQAPKYARVTPEDIRSELHLPLIKGDHILGVLSLRSRKKSLFGDHQLIPLKNLASQMAIALDQIGHSDERDGQSSSIIERQHRQDTNVHTLLPDFHMQIDIQDLLDRIVNAVVYELGYLGSFLAVLDEEKQQLPVRAIAFDSYIHRLGLLEQIEKVTKIRAIGAYASLIDDPGNLGVQSCLAGDIKISHDLYDLFQPALSKRWSRWVQRMSGIKTCISIPLMVGEKVVGNMFASTTKSDISKDDLDALQLFVTNAAIAIQNTMLFEEVNQKLARREAELQQLRGIEKSINAKVENLENVLERILHGALELTQAAYGHVVLAGKYASASIDRVSYPELPKSFRSNQLGITQLIMRDKKPKIVDNAELLAQKKKALENLAETESVLFSKMRSQSGVPIISSGDELIGVINIGSQEDNAFDEQSIHMLEQLAVQAAIAIKNAHQFKEQKAMQKQLASVNQVVAMGDIAGNMVHSINNWVGSIRADARYLLRQFEENDVDPEEALEILADMLKNAEMTLTMAEKIRRPFQPVDQEPVDVNECLLNVLQERQEALADVLVYPELNGLPLVEANQQLQLVFDNLVGNALQAMDGQERKKMLSLVSRLSRDQQWVEVRIRDSGPGLPSHFDKNNIFKLGITSRTEGMGYGLWWCDTFLKRLHGDIELLSTSERGCEFLVRLPVPPPNEAEAS